MKKTNNPIQNRSIALITCLSLFLIAYSINTYAVFNSVVILVAILLLPVLFIAVVYLMYSLLSAYPKYKKTPSMSSLIIITILVFINISFVLYRSGYFYGEKYIVAHSIFDRDRFDITLYKNGNYIFVSQSLLSSKSFHGTYEIEETRLVLDNNERAIIPRYLNHLLNERQLLRVDSLGNRSRKYQYNPFEITLFKE